MRGLILTLCVLTLGAYCQADDDASIGKIRAAIQNRQFDDAVELIDSQLAKSKDDQDYLIYLKGLSLFYSDNFDEAIECCDEVIDEHEKSSWHRRAVFLKAQCHIRLKQFEEAEKIYSTEARRLLSTARKEEFAKIFFGLAEEASRKPDKDELDAPPPNYQKASELYTKSLKLEIGRAMKDEAMFRLGRMKQLDEKHGRAIKDYRKYLTEFDPNWRNRNRQNVAEIARIRGNKAGKHVYETRYYLAECQLAKGQSHLARINLEDLIKLIPKSNRDQKSDKDYDKIVRSARFLLIKTYHIPEPKNNSELTLGVKSARSFLRDFPNDPRSIALAYDIAQSYFVLGWQSEAIDAYRYCLERELPEVEQIESLSEIERTDKSPAELFKKLQMSAMMQIGTILFGQKNYTGAIKMWNQYISQFPDGPKWTEAQQNVIDAEFEMGVDLIAEKKYDEAIEVWNKFLEKHPLDHRSRQIMFTYGQMHYHEENSTLYHEENSTLYHEENSILYHEENSILYHEENSILYHEENSILRCKEEYRKAIAEWEKLVNKYPKTEESSLALFRIGRIYEEKLGNLEKALKSYRKLNWGKWQGNAQKRIRDMTEKKLQLVTERVFRTNETARVKVSLRNIEKLTVDVYKLDLEAYWRKMHKIKGVENLDIALIAPDKTWEYNTPDYQKYKPFEEEIEIVVDLSAQSGLLNPDSEQDQMDAPGVYAVHVSDEELEATTLVIRSDIELIMKTSRREVLVFAEDMLKKQPAKNARVLVSDGEKVVCEGQTDQDGIFQQKLDELKDASVARSSRSKVTAFVVKDGNVASDLLDISDLNLSKGLSPRGYIYTDRPAYRPGQKVSIRGIVRDVSDGVYVGQVANLSDVEQVANLSDVEQVANLSDVEQVANLFYVSILDSQGRVLRSEKLELSKFGTFHTETTLDDNAPVGEYRIVVEHKQVSNLSFVGNFEVQKFQLEKMKLTIDFPQRVYFRGEKISATFTASYYYGQPVSEREIKYTLPDGRSFTKATDDEGKLNVSFDTTPMRPGTPLTFRGDIEGENVQIADTVFLARLGFEIAVKPSADVVIAGEPFDLSVETTGADSKPVGKELTLTVYRRTKLPSHPILSKVPWIRRGSGGSGKIEVEKHKIVTDDETGKAMISLSLEKGGEYALWVSGTDRFDQRVVSESSVFISDDEDDVKLRTFAKRSKLKVGETEKIGIHSRLKLSIALVTFEGEGIIAHKIMTLNEGMNELEFAVGHEHFPNFHIGVAMIDDLSSKFPKSNSRPRLQQAGKDFTVERELLISIKPKEFYRPGEEAEIEITATDQLGNPVEAELSLALVDSALFAKFPDKLTPIADFFNEGLKRDAAMRTSSSCAFRYRPPTRRVLKEMLEEVERLAREDAEHAAYSKFRASKAFDELEAELSSEALGEAPALRQKLKEKGDALSDWGMSDKKTLHARKPIRTRIVKESVVRYGRGAEMIAVRKEFADAGYWLPAVVTDVSGKATAKISMPEKTTQWRLTARACTVETLVGQLKVNTITRKDFFLDVKLPRIVTEGDKIRVLARVHNLTEFSGDVELTLKAGNVENETRNTPHAMRKQIQIEKNGTTEVFFDEIEIPAGQELQVELTAQMDEMTDGISRTIPIRPWGIEVADSQGGVSSGDETIFLGLEDEQLKNRRLTISVGQSVNRLIFNLVQQPRLLQRSRRLSYRVPGDAGSDLLAAAYALDYLKKVGGTQTNSLRYKELVEYARGLVAQLVVRQKDDGGWSWCRGSADSDLYVSSRTVWALASARRQGISVDPKMIEKSVSYLKEKFTRVDQNDNETKAVILHALSRLGEADFAYANRLYRNRNEMSSAALAYTALIFANLDRSEIGGEVLDVLESKVKRVANSSKKMVWWTADKNLSWTASEVETTALALLAFESIRPTSPLVKQAVEYLLSKRTFCGFSPYKAKGPAVAALATYYGKTQFAEDDYRLTIFVNGEKVASDLQRHSEPFANSGEILRFAQDDITPKLIRDGENRIDFKLEGKGRYAYTATLSGFSSKFKDPKSWEKPFVKTRRYFHAPLEYKGRPIRASSSTEITSLPDGERTYVSVKIEEKYSNRYLVVDEYLPAGTMLVESAPPAGNYHHYEVGDGMLRFYYPPGRRLRNYRYQLVSYAPGTYRVMPTVIRDAMRPGEMRIGKEHRSKNTVLVVLAPGEKSKDEYKMNDGEFYYLGKAYFDDGKYVDALPLLSKLHEKNPEYHQREVAQMLLWIYTTEKYYDAQKLIEQFEILRERFPELYIPFEKIIVVGRAYRDIKEFERAYLVYKATIDASFVNDSNVSAVLEDEDKFLESIDFQENLWREYPDSPQVVSSYFALSQAIYSKSAKWLKGNGAITKLDLLKETVSMLSQFLTLYPNDPLADDASFSMANVLLDLEAFPTVVKLCRSAQKRYAKSEYQSSFQYVEGLGLFSQRKYDSAIDAAKLVADGESKDQDLARYILGQIYHAQGKPESAISWYQKVETSYPDAHESIAYFEEKRISLDEVNVFRPNEVTKLDLKYRNIKEAAIQVYRVDLMKLYLREKNLSKIRQIQLAGIDPEFSMNQTLGDGKDYIDKEYEIELDLKEEGAYLVICRGDELFTSGLVLISPLEIEVQEDPGSGRVRVNVKDVVSEAYEEGVHVKVIGSADKEFRAGETDLRGLFIADDIRGKSTVIARQDKKLYAFYRGEQWLGAPKTMEGPSQERSAGLGIQKYKANYRANIEQMNQAVQGKNFIQFDQMRRGVRKGVQVQEAR